MELRFEGQQEGRKKKGRSSIKHLTTEVKSVPSLSLHPYELLTQKHGGWRLKATCRASVWYPNLVV